MTQAIRSSDVIYVDIVDKTGPQWRIIGSCPESVSVSGGLHVYAGRNACVRDCLTSDMIAEGRSLSDVLTRLATQTGLTVVLTDEATWQERRYTPEGVIQ